jgi:hypothetical protein
MLVNAERIIARFEQQPWEKKRYRVDFRDHLADGETIVTPTFVISPTTTPPLAVSNVAIAPDADQLVMFIEGGVDGTLYRITMRTTTSDLQKLEDEIEVSIRVTFAGPTMPRRFWLPELPTWTRVSP